MTLVRAAFLGVLLSPIVGILGSQWVISTFFDQSPNYQGPPVVAARRTSEPTAKPVHRRLAPTASPTARPSATARPHAQASKTPAARPQPAVTPTVPTRPQSVAVTRPQRHTPTRRRGPSVGGPRRGTTAKTKAIPMPTPTTAPTPLPTPVPTIGTVTLVRYWIGSTVARPGTMLSVGYVIENGTGQTARISLGASIKPSRALSWANATISDPARDVVATVVPGATTHARYFQLPANLRPGLYDVAWGLRNADTGARQAVVFSPGVLQITR